MSIGTAVLSYEAEVEQTKLSLISGPSHLIELNYFEIQKNIIIVVPVEKSGSQIVCHLKKSS